MVRQGNRLHSRNGLWSRADRLVLRRVSQKREHEKPPARKNIRFIVSGLSGPDLPRFGARSWRLTERGRAWIVLVRAILLPSVVHKRRQQQKDGRKQTDDARNEQRTRPDSAATLAVLVMLGILQIAPPDSFPFPARGVSLDQPFT